MNEIVINPQLLKEHGYSVYEHIFPDGKKYIGLAKGDPKKRWGNDGRGYSGVQSLREAIQKFGWDNIEHNVILTGLQRAQAQKLEKYLIKSFDTIEQGYNTRPGGEAGKTLYSDHVQKMIRESKRFNNPDIDEFMDVLSMFSNIENAAYQINILDLVLREEIEEFINCSEDQYLKTAIWIYYIKNGIMGEDIRKIPKASQFVHEQLTKTMEVI